MKLYDVPGNASTRKVRAVANEVDVRLEMIPVNMREGEGQKPEYLKINPNGKIPSLVDGDFKLFETNAILCYLAAKGGKSALLPSDAQGRAHVDQWLHWQNAHLAPAMTKIAVERYYKPQFNLGAPDQAKIDEGLKELDRFCTILDGWLASRDYVCNAITVADFSLAGTFAHRVVTQVDLGKWTNLTRWLARIEARPSWVHAEA